VRPPLEFLIEILLGAIIKQFLKKKIVIGYRKLTGFNSEARFKSQMFFFNATLG
jgi:hypothetical protein